MNLKKYSSIGKFVFVGFIAVTALIAFLIYLKPEKPEAGGNNKQVTEEKEISFIKSDQNEAALNKSVINKIEPKAEVEEVAKEVEESSEASSFKEKGYKVTHEDDFVEYVKLPNGTTTPLFKSYMAGDEEELEADFQFEARNEEWASNWEITLNSIVANAGSTFSLAESKITCKSKICKIGVKLDESNPYGYNDAYNSLNREFVLNKIKVVPGSMKEKGTGHIIHYFVPKN